MKKILICSIPMREHVAKTVYASNDRSLPTSEKPFCHPILSFLEKTARPDDELKTILLIKKDRSEFYKRNIDEFKAEMDDVLKTTGATAEYVTIDTDFSEDKRTHEMLMGALVDEVDAGTHILADITYGPKDVPVIIFAALSFAENFLGCEVENIVYGQAKFKNNEVVSSRLCDMSPLYFLSSVANTIQCDDPAKAKQMLRTLISL